MSRDELAGSPQLPLHELERRRDSVVERMHESSTDVIVVTSPLNIYYLTGIELGGFVSPQALVLTADGDHAYVVREMETTWQEHWNRRSWCTHWSSFTDADDPWVVIGAAAKRLTASIRPRCLGLERDRQSLSYSATLKLERAIEPTKTWTATRLVEELRVTKSSLEVGYIRRAGQMTLAGLHAQLDAIRAGATDADAVAAGISEMLRAGSSLLADPPFLPVGPTSWRAHGHWDHVKPVLGDVVTPMLSGSFGRYQCPVERSFCVGEPSPELRRALDAVVEVQTHLLGTLRPGLTSAEADNLARSHYRELGLEQFFLNRLAYSIGIAYPPAWWENEIMQLRPGDDRVLEPGMTFHIVPCLCIPDVGFINRSMPVVLTERGCEPLIDLPVTAELL